MPEDTHIFDIKGKKDPKIWLHSKLEKEEYWSRDDYDSSLGSDDSASQCKQGRPMELLPDHSQSSDNDFICAHSVTKKDKFH
jgi:hypothetical protein